MVKKKVHKELHQNEYEVWEKGKKHKCFAFQVDQQSLRGYLEELSKEPHIAAGRRDKWELT